MDKQIKIKQLQMDLESFIYKMDLFYFQPLLMDLQLNNTFISNRMVLIVRDFAKKEKKSQIAIITKINSNLTAV